jgi:hypothetical protein
LIVAVYTCKDEADIVEASFRHALEQGVDRVYTTDQMSSDGTSDILRRLAAETGQIVVTEDHERYHRQPYWMNRQIAQAGADGATWIIAGDVDEFVYASSGGTAAEALNQCPHSKLYLTVWQQLDWEHRFVDPQSMLKKVAFRWSPGVTVTNGNHECSVPSAGVLDVLDVREWKYRGFEHFVAKIHKQNLMLDPIARDAGASAHTTCLEGFDTDALRKVWDARMSQESVYDPIPFMSGNPLI